MALSTCKPHTDEQFVILEQANDQLEATTEPSEALRLDAAWHDLLLSNSSNRVALAQLTSLKRRAQRYEYQYLADQGRVRQASSQHRQILQALRNNDVDDACAALGDNWLYGAERIGAWLLETESSQVG